MSSGKTATGEKERRLYKLLRGSYSRREGELQPHVDNETGNRTKRKSRPFVHYAAKTMRNPNARDELYLTDAEARAIGFHNLRHLVPREARARDLENGVDEPKQPDVEELMKRSLPEDARGKVDMLIEEGQLIRKNGQLQTWRERVFRAGVLETEIPNRRVDVLEALQRVGA